jgi:hypothetical protein
VEVEKLEGHRMHQMYHLAEHILINTQLNIQ